MYRIYLKYQGEKAIYKFTAGLVSQARSAHAQLSNRRPDQHDADDFNCAQSMEAGTHAARPENTGATSSRGLPADIYYAGAQPLDGADCCSALYLSGSVVTAAHTTICGVDQFAFRPTGSTTAAIISLLHSVINLLSSEPYVILSFHSISRKLLTLYGTHHLLTLWKQ